MIRADRTRDDIVVLRVPEYRHSVMIYKPISFGNRLIPPGLAKRFTAALTKTEKLRNDVSVITICLAKLYIYRRPTANVQSCPTL